MPMEKQKILFIGWDRSIGVSLIKNELKDISQEFEVDFSSTPTQAVSILLDAFTKTNVPITGLVFSRDFLFYGETFPQMIRKIAKKYAGEKKFCSINMILYNQDKSVIKNATSKIFVYVGEYSKVLQIMRENL